MAKRTMHQIMTDENCLTMSLLEAAQMLGICKNTAYEAAKRNGHLCEGVPVFTIEATGNLEQKKLIVSTAHIKKVLGHGF